jgi:uncharacterized phage-associated protein
MSDIVRAGVVEASVHDVCDYLIVRLTEAAVYLNVLKLQKLLYYVQAWHVTFFGGRRCFDSAFEAWVHGPVSPPIYRRFRDSKSLYSTVGTEDCRPDFNLDNIPAKIQAHINSVLEVYAPLTDDQLEIMTHEEAPWIKARDGYAPGQRCQVAISEAEMQAYYGQRLREAAAQGA